MTRGALPPLDGAGILVLDDEPEVVRSVADALERYGASVCCAATVECALRALRGRSFDGAVVDLALPGAWGLNLAAQLARARCTFIVLSGFAGANIDECLRAGAFDVRQKPIPLRELVEAAARAIARTRDLRERFPLSASSEPNSERAESTDTITLSEQITIKFAAGGPLVVVAQKAADFTPTEARVLAQLAAQSGTIVNRRRLVETCLDVRSEIPAYQRNLDAHITRIRRKLREIGFRGSIQTARGIGYSLEL